MTLHSFGLGYWCIHRRTTGGFIVRSYSSEIESPWRNGRGISVRLGSTAAVSVGFWVHYERAPGWDIDSRDLDVTPEEIDSWA